MVGGFWSLSAIALINRSRGVEAAAGEQDGAYLAEFLLDKGYEVHGIKRRTSHRPPLAVT